MALTRYVPKTTYIQYVTWDRTTLMPCTNTRCVCCACNTIPHIRVFVCSCVRVFVCSCVRVFVCSCARVLVCSCARVLVCSCARVLGCSCARVLVCSCARVCACEASVHACLRARARLCMYVCMYEQHHDTNINFQICFFRTALTSEEVADINDDPSVVYDM